ncbi:hypothetical protein PFMC_05239, partial [Plasmodium falciparum CAMP/Malaysia]
EKTPNDAEKKKTLNDKEKTVNFNQKKDDNLNVDNKKENTVNDAEKGRTLNDKEKTANCNQKKEDNFNVDNKKENTSNDDEKERISNADENMKDENKEAEKKKKKRKKKRKSKKSDNKENEVTLVSNDVKSDQLVQEDKNEIQNPLVDNEAADSTADQNPDKKVFVITYSWKNLKDVNDKAMKLNLDDQMKESNYTNNNKNDKGVLLNLF